MTFSTHYLLIPFQLPSKCFNLLGGESSCVRDVAGFEFVVTQSPSVLRLK